MNEQSAGRLFERLKGMPVPEGVVPLPSRLRQFAFFPGSTGTAVGRVVQPGGVMVLGHNFYSVAGFEEIRRSGKDDWASSTGRALVELLPRGGLDPYACFYTNFFMGLIAGKDNVGAFPGRRDANFVRWCLAFLNFQIEVVRPRVVLVLGIQTPRRLAALAPQLSGWAMCRSFAVMDAAGLGIVDDVQIGGNSLTFVALTHPSIRGPNVHRRRFGGQTGDDAEVAMLKLACARLPTRP